MTHDKETVVLLLQYRGVEGAVDAALEVGRARGQQLSVEGVEGAAEHGALELLLEVLTDPSV